MKIVSVICYLLLAGGTAVLTEEVWCSWWCWGWGWCEGVEGGWEEDFGKF